MKILQLLSDNAGRQKQPLNLVRNGADASLYIYDVISSYWGVSAISVAEQLNNVGDATTLHVYLNTPGGDVFEGRAIMALIQRFAGKTVAHIDSLCASAGTSIALACSEVEMSAGAFFMIHNASGGVYGDKKVMRDTADLLEKVEGSIVGDYVKKTGKGEAEVIAWMDAETWFSADEAIEAGFVDRLAPAAGAATNNTWNLAAFNNAPKALSTAQPAPAPPPAPVEAPAPALAAKPSRAVANANRLRLLEAV